MSSSTTGHDPYPTGHMEDARDERADQMAQLVNENAMLREENAEFIAMLEADAFRLDVVGRRIARLEHAIRTHRLNVWGGYWVGRVEDRDLYAVLAGSDDQATLDAMEGDIR